MLKNVFTQPGPKAEYHFAYLNARRRLNRVIPHQFLDEGYANAQSSRTTTPLVGIADYAPTLPGRSAGQSIGTRRGTHGRCDRRSPLHGAQSVLATAARASPDHANLNLDGQIYPLSLYLT